MKTIAIVDDDIHIGDLIQEALEKENYRTLRAYSGTEALLLLENQRPDLVLLDLMLPGLSGEEVLPKIKGLPVIIMSAKADIDGKVAMLLGGAADYVTKPFELRELLARIAVRLRAPEAEPQSLSAGGLSLDILSLTLTAGGVPVRLTRTELAILKLLMSNPGRVIARGALLDKISLDTPDCTERSLKQHISNLRHKIQGAAGIDPIETIWGIGFKLKN